MFGFFEGNGVNPTDEALLFGGLFLGPDILAWPAFCFLMNDDDENAENADTT